MHKKINLTPEEKKLFNYLNTFFKSCSCPTKKPLRVAGGWVRDKLLQLNSVDIDIALEDCSGAEYAVALIDWLTKEYNYSSKLCRLSKVDHEKSKHLEVATIILHEFNLSIDFVCLRSETYSKKSRIPQVIVGTPKSDAFRRDLTINALFYNINDDTIEDFTQLGISDLTNKILRTPMNPKIILTDDPIRIIRIIRFGSKLQDFTVCDELCSAIVDPLIKNGLRTKVSRERLLTEFNKIFSCINFSKSLYYIDEWNYWSYLLFPNDTVLTEVEIKKFNFNFTYKLALVTDNMIRHILFVKNTNDKIILFSDETLKILHNYYNSQIRRVISLICILYYTNGETISTNSYKTDMFQYLFNNLQLKKKHLVATIIIKMIYHFYELMNNKIYDKDDLAYILTIEIPNEYWQIALLIACILRAMLLDYRHLYEQHLTNYTKTSILNQYSSVIDAINHYHLDNIWNLPDLCDGNYIKEILLKYNLTVPKYIKFLKDQLLFYQISKYSSKKTITKEEYTSFLFDCIENNILNQSN